MKKSMYAERLMCFITMGWENDGGGDGADQAGNSANRKGQGEIAHIAEDPTEYRKGDSACPVGEKDVGIVLPNASVAELVGGKGREEGKITAEEGAKLLSALSESTSSPRRQTSSVSETRKGWLRVRVTDLYTGKTKVNVNLPLGLVDAGMNIAQSFVPDMAMDEMASAIKDSGMSGKIVDVIDEEDGEHVEIFIE